MGGGAGGRRTPALEGLRSVPKPPRRGKGLVREKRHGIAFKNKRELTSALKNALPFTLTNAQANALREIIADMTSDRKMHRLLQGDVGSGMSLLTEEAAFIDIANGHQVVVLVPTEIIST